MFFLRKPNFKLRACNHHIKGLPFFRRPPVCSVYARAVFSIRFPSFFQLIWQINLQQAEHKMQPGEEQSGKLHLSKTLNGTVYFMWSNKNMLTLRVCQWLRMIQRNSKRQAEPLWPHEEGATCKLHHRHLFTPSNCSGYLVRLFLPCWLAWWRYDCSHSLSHSFWLTSPIKTLGHILTDHLTFLNLHSY